MQFAAICDACKRALVEQVTSVQVMPGTIAVSPNGPTMRASGSPAAYFLCDRCIMGVLEALHGLMRTPDASGPA